MWQEISRGAKNEVVDYVHRHLKTIVQPANSIFRKRITYIRQLFISVKSLIKLWSTVTIFPKPPDLLNLLFWLLLVIFRWWCLVCSHGYAIQKRSRQAQLHFWCFSKNDMSSPRKMLSHFFARSFWPGNKYPSFCLIWKPIYCWRSQHAGEF